MPLPPKRRTHRWSLSLTPLASLKGLSTPVLSSSSDVVLNRCPAGSGAGSPPSRSKRRYSASVDPIKRTAGGLAATLLRPVFGRRLDSPHVARHIPVSYTHLTPPTK